MGRMPIIAALSAAVTLAAGGALAKPAIPSEMADSWLLQSHGQTLCQLKPERGDQAGVLGAPSRAGLRLEAGHRPARPAGSRQTKGWPWWRPTARC